MAITMAILNGIQPQDEIEGMLAVQMIGVHNLAMETLKRAMLGGQNDKGKELNVYQATKMLRTFIAQMDALKKYRTGGQQKMIVKHVHVNAGGQAIVGTVNQGGAKKPMNKPCAKNNLMKGPRFGAKTRKGTPCRAPAMPNGRCRMHGGKSTGPRRPEGLERSRKANWKHGRYSAQSIAIRREMREFLHNCRKTIEQVEGAV